MYIEDMITGTDTNAIRTGRQKELDIGKAIPILCLPFVHCIIECCTDEQLLGGIPFLFDSVIGGPMSAPMFLFCMGATIHFGRAHTPEKLARRGVYLILIGFLLNICRFFIPYMIGYGWTGDKEQFLTPLVYRVFGNDVLQFAGLAMLVMALFVWIRLPAAGMLAVALAMSVTGTFVRGIDLGNDTLNIAGGWLIGTVNEADLVISDFPILNWLIVPVAGYVFGGILRGVQDKHRFYLRFSPICLLVAVIAMAIGIHGEYGMFGEGQNAYYHISTLDVLICIALTLGLLGVYDALTAVLPQKIMDFLTYTSQNITKFYCVHWVFVRVITNVIFFALLGTQVIPVPMILLLSFGIVLLTFLVLWVYNAWIAGRLHKKKGDSL